MLSIRSRLTRLEATKKARRINPATLAKLRADPAATLMMAGLTPDEWQSELLRGRWSRALCLTGRQCGKSTGAAGLAIHTPLTKSGSTTLIASPSLRQSIEAYRKVIDLYHRLGRPVPAVRENATFVELGNGSRVVAIPGNERTIRGFSSPALVIVDEAARVPDGLLAAVNPMLAVGAGRLLALTTPFGCRGWFHREFSGSESWHRVRITADQCARITPAFLASEQRSLGERWYRQEYLCSFEADTDAVFSHEYIVAAAVDEPPLDLGMCA